MKNLLEFILIYLVDNPEDVIVEETNENELDSFLYTVYVHPDDVGRVIGKSGNTINAIRNIVKIRAIKENKQVAIKVDSSDKS